MVAPWIVVMLVGCGGTAVVDSQLGPTAARSCERACPVLLQCLATEPDDCEDGCNDDLADCSPSELDDVDRCTDELGQECAAEAWVDCMSAIACIDDG
jgi:hypothetical protein